MKKIIAIVLSILFISTISAKAEYAVGITGALHSIDTSGQEKLRQSQKITTAEKKEEAIIPEVFFEIIGDGGSVIGISYIPVRELGSKSRTDSNTGGDSGDYKADAELDDVIQVYVDIPFSQYGDNSIYAKVGIQHATVVTKENLNSGSTYGDDEITGLTLGIGTRADLAYADGLFYKAEATYTDFIDGYHASSSAGNEITADLDSMAVKISLGYKF
tara:strand:- start:1034 stop:1684 length:651 start_codon:yes stop_codon:yes gene_type:complete